MNKPNVLIFCVDEMRADHLGCAGNKTIKTPNIDRLARLGTYFPNGYCNNPICMPARASMFTGMLPRDHGLRVNGQTLRKDIPTLPDIMAQNGYFTHSAGKLHLSPWTTHETPEGKASPENILSWTNGGIKKIPVPYYGFQSVDFVGGHTAFAYGEYMQWLEDRGGDPRWLRESIVPPSGAPGCYQMKMPEELHYNRFIADSTIKAIQTSADTPFFIWSSFPDPHCPCAPPEPYAKMYNPDEVELPAQRDGEINELPPFYRDVLSGRIKPNGIDNSAVEPEHWKEIIALTYGMITHLDKEIGRVLDYLESEDKIKNTIICFISDHGDMMGDHGLLWKSFYTFRGCTNIPFIIAAPGGNKNSVNQHLVSQIDLMPTILDLCGLPLPGADWKSVETTFERGSLMELNNYSGMSLRPMLLDGNEKVRDSVVIENDDPTTGFHVRCMVTDKYRIAVYPGTEHGELFDIMNDPDELHNLWYDESCSALKNKLIFELLSEYAGDTPFGPVPSGNS